MLKLSRRYHSSISPNHRYLIKNLCQNSNLKHLQISFIRFSEEFLDSRGVHVMKSSRHVTSWSIMWCAHDVHVFKSCYHVDKSIYHVMSTWCACDQIVWSRGQVDKRQDSNFEASMEILVYVNLSEIMVKIWTRELITLSRGRFMSCVSMSWSRRKNSRDGLQIILPLFF